MNSFEEDVIPFHFNVQPWLDKANILALYDEVALALKSLEDLPAYYRDNMPVEVLNLKNRLLAKISDPSTYARCEWDHVIDPAVATKMQWSLRGMLISEDVRWLNEAGIAPQIIDYGPGEYWLPLMLIKENLDFKYFPIYLHQESFNVAKKYFEDKLITEFLPHLPTIYVACEIIEHLWHEEDIKANVLRLGVTPDIVHISTPKYAFDSFGPMPNGWTEDEVAEHYTKTLAAHLTIDEKMALQREIWARWELRGELGHLRTYTPLEFNKKLAHMWPGYVDHFYNSKILHSRLINAKSEFKEIKDTLSTNMLELAQKRQNERS